MGQVIFLVRLLEQVVQKLSWVQWGQVVEVRVLVHIMAVQFLERVPQQLSQVWWERVVRVLV